MRPLDCTKRLSANHSQLAGVPLFLKLALFWTEDEDTTTYFCTGQAGGTGNARSTAPSVLAANYLMASSCSLGVYPLGMANIFFRPADLSKAQGADLQMNIWGRAGKHAPHS